MLRKAIKHEFRATVRVMLPIYIALLSLSLVTRLLQALNGLTGTTHWALNLLAVLTVMLFFIGLFAACAGVLVLAGKRFYASFLSDEGYLTMTLPVSTNKLIFARLLVSVVWYALTLLVSFVAMCVMLLTLENWGGLFKGMGILIREVAQSWHKLDAATVANIALMLTELICCCVFAAALVSLVLYAAMAVGHSFNRHKKAWSVLFGFVFYHAAQIFGAVGIGRLALLWPDLTGKNIGFLFNLLLGMVMLVIAAGCAVYWYITHYFLSRRLNLE